MRRLIEFPLANGDTIIVEVEVGENEQGAIVPAARPGELIAKAALSFEDALSRILPAANIFIENMRGLVVRPDEIEVQFGLKFSAEAGAIIAAVGTEANYTMTLKWKAPEHPYAQR